MTIYGGPRKDYSTARLYDDDLAAIPEPQARALWLLWGANQYCNAVRDGDAVKIIVGAIEQIHGEME